MDSEKSCKRRVKQFHDDFEVFNELVNEYKANVKKRIKNLEYANGRYLELRCILYSGVYPEEDGASLQEEKNKHRKQLQQFIDEMEADKMHILHQTNIKLES